MLRPFPLALLLATAVACAPADEGGGDPVPADGPPPAACDAGTGAPAAPAPFAAFGFRLLDAVLGSAEPGANVFVSGPSAALALAMAHHGAAGETRRAMGRALGEAEPGVNERSRAWLAGLAGQDCVELAVANSLWLREGVPFVPAFVDTARTAFDARVAQLDFAADSAAPAINRWVAGATRGRIGGIVEAPLADEAVAFLVNAVYFKGDWRERFSRADTRDRPFRRADGSVVQRPAMERTGSYAVLDGDGFRAVRIPYRGDRFAMYVLLPDSGSSPRDVARRLTPERWDGWMRALRGTGAGVRLVLPRFRVEYGATLNGVLAGLGMGVAFDPERADFTAMVPRSFVDGGRRVWISDVRQRVFVEVDEKGTEAAAVTSVGMTADSAGDGPVDFVVDRPFLAAIRDDHTGAVLFLGRVADPAP